MNLTTAYNYYLHSVIISALITMGSVQTITELMFASKIIGKCDIYKKGV